MSTTYRRYLLVCLSLILAFNYVDRLALGLMLENIKVDLSLNDTQLGMLTGIAFAFFYSLVGIPIARWADRGNRVLIISATTLIWSMAVASCGLAQTFVQLLAIRVAVAVGEAGCIPPAHSLIADHFSRAERPRAVSLYMLGAPLSMLIGYLFAGGLNEQYGWRVTFAVLGLPGIALAALAWFTLREPRLKQPSPAPGQWSARGDEFGMVQACQALWANPTFRQLLLGFAVLSFFNNGMLQWKPAFFIRSFGMQTGALGVWLALIYGAGGLVGTYLGGMLASRHAAQNETLQLKALAMVYCAIGVVSAGIYLSSFASVALSLLALTAIGTGCVSGPLYATIQTLVPERMRALSIAILYLSANLVGLGLGPVVAGALSDSFRPWAGEDSLRYALLALCPGLFWGAWHLWRASRTVARDVEVAHAH